MKILTPNADYIFETPEGSMNDKDYRDSAQVVRETWVENVYQIEKTDFVHTGVFIDIGANIGAVSCYVASFNDDSEINNIKVLAYEPEPTNLQYLNKNIKRNKQTENIKVRDVAVMESEGVGVISDAGGNSKVSNVIPKKWAVSKDINELILDVNQRQRLYEFREEKEAGSEISVITLEDIFEREEIEECDVLKMDIEGAEKEIIMNASLETLERIRYLTMEFDGLDPYGEDFGEFIGKLATVFNLHIIGKPLDGGYIYGRRY